MRRGLGGDVFCGCFVCAALDRYIERGYGVGARFVDCEVVGDDVSLGCGGLAVNY